MPGGGDPLGNLPRHLGANARRVLEDGGPIAVGVGIAEGLPRRLAPGCACRNHRQPLVHVAEAFEPGRQPGRLIPPFGGDGLVQRDITFNLLLETGATNTTRRGRTGGRGVRLRRTRRVVRRGGRVLAGGFQQRKPGGDHRRGGGRRHRRLGRQHLIEGLQDAPRHTALAEVQGVLQ